jgi:hypothetical protein
MYMVTIEQFHLFVFWLKVGHLVALSHSTLLLFVLRVDHLTIAK